MDYEIAIFKSLRFIEKNIKDNLSLKLISSQVGYSEYHFSRIFKSKMKVSVIEYVQQRKLLLAAREIFNGRKIVDVSIDYGYETHSGFSKAFKKKFGFTPTQHLIYAMTLLNSMKFDNKEVFLMENKNNANVFINSPKDFTNIENLYSQLILNIKSKFDKKALDEIEKAYLLSCRAHKNQYRKSGEPYIVHPLNIALILSNLDVDKETLMVGLLYDVIRKNTCVTLDIIKSEISSSVSNLLKSSTEFNPSYFDKITDETSSIDARVFIIHLASRLHNMRTIKYINPNLYEEKSKETIKLFSPLASSLNLLKLKMELDDLSIKYLIN